MLNANYKPYLFLILAAGIFSSCKKDDPIPTAPAIPSTYNYENVNYSGQLVRLLLLDTLMQVVSASEGVGASVTKAQLEAIYDNTGNFYASIITGKNLSGKVYGGLGGTIDFQIRSWFDSIATRSALYDGKEAVITTDSIDLPEMIEKTIMGSVFYYRAVNDYINMIGTMDNTVVTATGTVMEHGWDEAFGYFGSARDYNTYSDEEIINDGGVYFSPLGFKDSNGDGKINPASERNFFFSIDAAKRDKVLDFTTTQTNFTSDIFKAFIKGRYGISNNDFAKRDEAASEVRNAWEKMIAASIVHDIKHFGECTDAICRAEEWSELKGIFDMLQYEPNNKLGSSTNPVSNYSIIKGVIGNKPSDVVIADLNNASNTIKAAYGF